MNDNATKLVDALRSGEFEQCHNYLRRAESYCCLGVASELYRREHSDTSLMVPMMSIWMSYTQKYAIGWVSLIHVEGS
jgi:hypothetical protein